MMSPFSPKERRRLTLWPTARLVRMRKRRHHMIELTQEQVQALGKPESTPPRVVNPQTRELFVLVPLAEYERLIDEQEYDDRPWTDEERDQLRWEACQMLDSFGKDA